MAVTIDLKEKDREAIAKVLGTLLADEYVLYTKIYKYHWNVTGNMFNDLHAMFQMLFEEMIELADEVAERIRALGGFAPGTLKEFLERTRLEEFPGSVPGELEMVENLLDDYEAVICNLRRDIVIVGKEHGDAGTNHLLSHIILKLEKRAWMLRSFVTK